MGRDAIVNGRVDDEVDFRPATGPKAKIDIVAMMEENVTLDITYLWSLI